MSKSALKPIEGTTNTYLLSYDYKLFPVAPNTFELKIILPFAGFVIQDAGDEVKLTVVAPIDAIINATETKGIDSNGNPIAPEISTPSTRKPIVSFNYKIDPTFVVKYSYNA